MPSDEPHCDFRWPVSAERQIKAPAREVWAAISQPGNLEFCHPFCECNPVRVWPGPDSRDEIHYLSGWVYKRQFRRWIDGVGYDLDIGRSGGSKSSVTWRITPIDDHNCSLRITVRPSALQNLHVIIRWIPHLLWLRPLLRKYLDSVVRGFEWYVIYGESVPKNAFGTHPWFSSQKSTST